MANLFESKIIELLQERPDVAEELSRIRSRSKLRDALIDVRRSMDFTQHELARRTGWKQPYVSRFERVAGQNPESLSVGKIAEYAEACGVRAVIAFIGRDDTKLVASFECQLALEDGVVSGQNEIKSISHAETQGISSDVIECEEDSAESLQQKAYAV